MGRRIKLVDPVRYELPKAQCVVKGCTTEPRDGALICHLCAPALHKLTQETK